MWNSRTSVFPNTYACECLNEQQSNNEESPTLPTNKETEEVGKLRIVNMDRSTAGTKKKSPDGLTVA